MRQTVDIPVDQSQLDRLLECGKLALRINIEGDFNARMMTGKHTYDYVPGPDPVAVVRLCAPVVLQGHGLQDIFVGSLITEIHSCVPCSFEPCFMYDSFEHAITMDAHKAVKACVRAILRPRLLDKCPRQIYTQDECFDPYMDKAYDSLVGTGDIFDHAVRQTGSLIDAGLMVLINNRFGGDVNAVKESMRHKWC